MEIIVNNTLEELSLLLTSFDSVPYPNKPDDTPEINKRLIELFNDDSCYYAVYIDNIRDGAYYGRQCNLTFLSAPMFGQTIEFEIAWDDNTIAVYTAANHNGYWVAPYSTNLDVLETILKETSVCLESDGFSNFLESTIICVIGFSI